MITINFKRMELSEDQNTVKIIGDCLSYKFNIEMSILQLAKIFGTNKEIVKELEKHFGSVEYEDKCNETREFVKKFPKIKVWNKELEFDYVSIEDERWSQRTTDSNIIGIYAEDIVGWNNEGIRIDFPKNIFDKKLKNKLKNKKLIFSVNPFSIHLNIKEKGKKSSMEKLKEKLK